MYLMGLIPLILALVVLLKDARKKRRFVLNILILGNLIFFYSPLILALFNTPYGESMWNENSNYDHAGQISLTLSRGKVFTPKII